MSHSFRKTRTKDKRARHQRGGRPPSMAVDGGIRLRPTMRQQCNRDDECLLSDGHPDACYVDAYL